MPGAGIGISLTETGTGLHHTAVAVVQGLAGGALLYSLLFRVLARERLKRLSGLLQAGGVILGFLVILTVEIFGSGYIILEGDNTVVQDTKGPVSRRRCWVRRRTCSTDPSSLPCPLYPLSPASPTPRKG